MTAISAANLTRLRTTRHATRLGLCVYAPATIWTGQVNGAQSQGSTSITVDNVVQVSAPARHYQVLFGSSAGASDYGEARFRSYGAPTLVVAPHNAQLPNDAYITIKEWIRPTALHVEIDATDVVFEDGNVAYANENIQYQPLARVKFTQFAFRNETTGLATVSFYSDSTAVATGATLSSYLWVMPGATYTVGNNTTAGTSGVPNVVTWNASGSYWCSLTVTDSNGKTHTRYFVVFVRDRISGTLPYSQLEISNCEGDVESGAWRATIKVYQAADTTVFVSGAYCALIAEDYYGADQISISQEPLRENIVIAGYIKRGTIAFDWKTSSVEFEIENMAGVAENLWEIGGGLEDTSGTPAGWHTLQNMTFDLAAHHVLTQHSTLSQLANVYFNLPSYTIEFVDLQDAALSETLRGILGAVRSRFSANAQGDLYLEINPQLQSLASRSVTYTIQTTNADLRDGVDLGDELPQKNVSQIDFCGDDSNADPFFSLAPANPWESGRSEKIDGIRITDQTQSNEFAGLYEGYRNNEYAEVVLNWRGNYRAFDIAPQNPIAVNITAAQNKRGIVWTNQRCWLKRISYSYRAGVMLTSTVVEKDAYGLPGVTGDYPATLPTEPLPPVPTWTPTPIPDPTFPGGTESGDFRARVYLPTLAKGVFYTGDFKSVNPNWSAVNGGLSSLACRILTAEPSAPSAHQYLLLDDTPGVTGNGSQKVWYRAGSGSWSAVADAPTLATAFSLPTFANAFLTLWCNINKASGYIAAVLLADSGGAPNYHYVYSTNYGAAWNYGAQMTSVVGGNTFFTFAGFFKGASAYAAGNVIYSGPAPQATVASQLIRSVDNGANFAQVLTTPNTVVDLNRLFDIDRAVLQIDLHQNIIYVVNPTNDKLWRSSDHGANFTDITPAGFDWTIAVPRIHQAENYRIVPLHDTTISTPANVLRLMNSDGKMYKTTNAAVSWSLINTVKPYADCEIGVWMYGDAPNKLYGINIQNGGGLLNDHMVWTTEDDGLTWTGKSGADRTSATVTGVPWDCGGIVGILPCYA